jgi:hypothetical protein
MVGPGSAIGPGFPIHGRGKSLISNGNPVFTRNFKKSGELISKTIDKEAAGADIGYVHMHKME